MKKIIKPRASLKLIRRAPVASRHGRSTDLFVFVYGPFREAREAPPARITMFMDSL